MNKKILICLVGFLLLLFAFSYPGFSFEKINISFQPAKDQPYFIGVPEINIDAEEFTTLVIKMKSSRSGTARLFWASNYDPQFNEAKSLWFFLDKSGNFKEYVFNVKAQNPYWLGFIKQLLIFPEGGIGGITIESAQATPGNLITNLKSGWREFWGPRGRLVIGSTINTIQSSNLFGRSIFVYIYWLLGLTTLGYFSYQTYKWQQLKKKPPFETVWLNTGIMSFITLITFWFLLEASSLFNNWLAFKDDLRYFGKSYREKLVLANTGDFYPFIEFCEANLPLHTKFDIRIPPLYNDIKARYYLYPRQMTTIEADYLIVYDMPVEPAVSARYVPMKIFRPNAYIMRRKG